MTKARTKGVMMSIVTIIIVLLTIGCVVGRAGEKLPSDLPEITRKVNDVAEYLEVVCGFPAEKATLVAQTAKAQGMLDKLHENAVNQYFKPTSFGIVIEPWEQKIPEPAPEVKISEIESEVDETSETAAEIEALEEQIPTAPATEEVVEMVEEISNLKKILLSDITTSSLTYERIWAIMNFLVNECEFTPEAAAAVVGNIAVESQFKPNAAANGYYGLCQWNTSSGGGHWWDDPKNGIKVWIESQGYMWDSFECQVRAIVYCPNRGLLNDSKLETFKALASVEAAVEYFAIWYESCPGGNEPTQFYNAGKCYQQLGLRKSEAWIAYLMYCNESDQYTGQKPYNG